MLCQGRIRVFSYRETTQECRWNADAVLDPREPRPRYWTDWNRTGMPRCPPLAGRTDPRCECVLSPDIESENSARGRENKTKKTKQNWGKKERRLEPTEVPSTSVPSFSLASSSLYFSPLRRNNGNGNDNDNNKNTFHWWKKCGWKLTGDSSVEVRYIKICWDTKILRY